MPPAPTLDAFDIRLLNIVQQDASLTAEQLAERVNLSASAIQHRLRRLKACGVISAQVAVVDLRRVERNTSFVVSLQVEREHPEQMAQLRHWLAAEAQVQQAYYVTGESDFILIVTAPDTEAYDALMSRLILDNPNVKRFTTNVALGVIKRGLAVPLAEDSDRPGMP
jgi:Lrp/AsnC family transcriptional regulator, leucine-responsive regulatory protein